MHRKKFGGESSNKPELTVTNYDLSPFMPQNSTISKSISFENESVETLHEKLVIKSEALNLLGKQLELCNKEKNEYKRLIDTLYDKNLALKKELYYQQQNQIDPEDENFLHLAKSGSLFSGSSSPNTKTNSKSPPPPQSHGFLLKAHRSKKPSSSNTAIDARSTSSLFNDIDSEDYMKILKDLIKTLQKEKCEVIQKYEESQQELNDAKNDLRLLREQIVRQRVGGYIEGLSSQPAAQFKLDINAVDLSGYEAMAKKQQQQLETPNHVLPTSHSVSSALSALSAANAANSIRESLIKEIEELRDQKNVIENDLRMALCQKEEIEIERDSFKEKYLKLNKFLIDTQTDPNRLDLNNNANNESSSPTIDYNSLDRSRISLCVDELVSKNKYLNESIQNMREELNMLKASSKFRQTSKPTQQQQPVVAAQTNTSTNRTELVAETGTISKQKVKVLLFKADQYLSQLSTGKHHNHYLDENEASELLDLIGELKSTLETLIEALNDKLIANAHQRKVNKMLAERIQDLERQLAKTVNLATSNATSIPTSSSHSRLDEPLVPLKTYDTNKC